MVLDCPWTALGVQCAALCVEMFKPNMLVFQSGSVLQYVFKCGSMVSEMIAFHIQWLNELS